MKLIFSPLLLLAYLLGGILSSVMLSSISPERLLQHVFMLVLGLVVFLYLRSQESAVYKSFTPFAYIIALILLGLTPIIGESIRGSTRWIMFGSFQLQTAEIAKPLLILSFAYFLHRFPPSTLLRIGLNLLVFAVPTFLIFKQPDLGTALVVSAVWVVEVFLAGIPWKYILISLFGFVILIPELPHFLHDYQLVRIHTFLDPFSDPLGSGYNVIQSTIAIGSGGIWGMGLGRGTQSHLRFLPERHTDFAFASLSEELGLIGTTFTLILISAFIFILLSATTHTSTRYSRLILSGCFAYFAFQSLVNIGMNLGIAPVTGIPLPLISYGGNSIISTGIILGFATSVIKSDKSPSLIEIK